MLSPSTPAWADSGTFTVTSTIGNTVSGTYLTPQGDTGTFTASRSAAAGYAGNAVFAGSASGLQLFNTADVNSDGGDSFTVTLTLTPNPGQSRSLTLEVSQATTQTSGNNEPARVTLTYGGAPYGSSSAVLAANPNVQMHDTNGVLIFGLQPQVRSVGPLCPAVILRNTTAITACLPMPAGTAIASGGQYQLYGVGNADSRYQIDIRNATTVTIGYTGNMLGSSTTPLYTGETFNEWLGFGVRSTPARITLNKNIAGRFVSTDQFTIRTQNIVTASQFATATTTATATNATTGPFKVEDGREHQLTETASGTTNLGYYAKSIACTNATGGSTTPLPSGTRPTPDWRVTPVAGDDITCTITNAVAVTDIAVTKTNTPGAGPSDQPGDTVTAGTMTRYSVIVRNNGPLSVTGVIVRDTPRTGITCPAGNTVTITGAGVPPGGPFTVGNLTGAGITLGTLAASQAATLTFQCLVN